MNLWHFVCRKPNVHLFRLAGEFSTFCLLLSLQNEAVDVDIDEILDMDTDDIRRSHLFVSVGGGNFLKCLSRSSFSIIDLNFSTFMIDVN